jgi:dolichyl-phosphate-mannose-protein mannosyltransferase
VWRSFTSPIFLVFAALSVALLALVSMNWFTPPKEGDALTGYMFTARWLYEHGLVYNPYNPRYSLFPLNTEMIYSLSFAFGTDLVAKSLDGLLGLTFLAAVYEFARRYTSALYSFFAAASLAIMKEFMTNWSSGKVDVLACFVCFAGISVLFKASKRSGLRLLVVGSFLIGTACSQKYTYWILCLTAPVWVYLLFREKHSRAVKAALVSAGVIALCLLPHFAKNIAWTDNPVAPFATNLIPSHNIHLGHTSDALPTSWADLLLFPYKLFFRYGLWQGPLPLLILVGVPLYLLARQKSRDVTLILGIAALQMVVWIAVIQSQWLAPRFIMLPVALLLVVAAVGLGRFCERRRLIRWATVAVMALLFAGLGAFTARHYRASLPFVMGREDRLSWQCRLVPHRGYGVLHDIGDKLGPDAKLMIATSLYNVPESKIPFISTEGEYEEFFSLPTNGKLEYLANHHFKYVYDTSKSQPDWATDLVVKDQVTGVKLYELQSPAAIGQTGHLVVNRTSRVW